MRCSSAAPAGVYETPGGSILLIAHRGIESITLDRGESHLKVRLPRLQAEGTLTATWQGVTRRRACSLLCLNL